MTKNHVSVLINLASQDGVIDSKELDLINKIGKSHGLSREEIDRMLKDPKEIKDFDGMTDTERFDCLYNLVHLMKVDGLIFDEEIQYCMDMAKKLGYPLEAVMELYSLVHANVKLTREIGSLKNKYCKE